MNLIENLKPLIFEKLSDYNENIIELKIKDNKLYLKKDNHLIDISDLLKNQFYGKYFLIKLNNCNILINKEKEEILIFKNDLLILKI